MKVHQDQFSILGMCRVFSVSTSGYYDWVRRQAQGSAQEARRETLDAQIKTAYEARKGRYGAPRLTVELRESGVVYNRKTVANSLRRQGLRAKAARKYKATTNSKHNLAVAQNRLDQDFSAESVNQKWAGDITYLPTGEGWLYLAVIIDLFSRRVIGWAASERMTAALVCQALHNALWLRRTPTDVIVHSDRGAQYCSSDYQKLIDDHGLLCSMSGKGNCYDNAMVESFFHTLKVEAIHGERFETRTQLKRVLREYIEIDYNLQRRHSALGYRSPIQFENDKET